MVEKDKLDIKKTVEIEENPVELEKTESQVAPIKRKRGRPRKHPLPDPSIPKVPKKRGRKPKPKNPEEQKTLVKAAKKPGRTYKKTKAALGSSLGKMTLSPIVKARKKINKKKLSDSLPGQSLANLISSDQSKLEKLQNSLEDAKPSEEKNEILKSFPKKSQIDNRPSWLKRDWTEGQRIVIKKGDSGDNEVFSENRLENNNQESKDPALQKEYVSKVIQQIKSVYTKRKGITIKKAEKTK